jgi:hypothetical protein
VTYHSQRSGCAEAATAAEEQMRAAFAANPPAALCAKVRERQPS